MDIGCKIEIVPKASGLTDATHRCTPFPNHIFGELLSYRYLFQGCHEGLLSFSKRDHENAGCPPQLRPPRIARWHQKLIAGY